MIAYAGILNQFFTDIFVGKFFPISYSRETIFFYVLATSAITPKSLRQMSLIC